MYFISKEINYYFAQCHSKPAHLLLQQADSENEQRRRLEQAAQQAEHVDPNKAKIMQKKQQVCDCRPYVWTRTDGCGVDGRAVVGLSAV